MNANQKKQLVDAVLMHLRGHGRKFPAGAYSQILSSIVWISREDDILDKVDEVLRKIEIKPGIALPWGVRVCP